MILRIENLIYNKTQFIKYFFIVFSNYIIKLVNEMFEKDFKMFDYDVFNDIKQIEEMDNE